jgi:putative ABC transport system ATP-binding protein
LHAGECIGLIGSSGSGKSTLLDLLALLRFPDSARLFRIGDVDVTELARRSDQVTATKLRGRRIGVVMQTGGLLPSLPLIENVLLPQRLNGKVALDWARHLLEVLGIDSLLHRLPAQLSVGQRQRAAIARALAHRPELVLADEPTSALGSDQSGQALDLLIETTRMVGAALVVASHDVTLLKSRSIQLRPIAVCGTQAVFDPQGSTGSTE